MLLSFVPQELQRLAEGKSEGKSKKSRRGMSWMYEMPLSASDGPIDATGEAADAFLSGKEVNDAVKGDLGGMWVLYCCCFRAKTGAY